MKKTIVLFFVLICFSSFALYSLGDNHRNLVPGPIKENGQTFVKDNINPPVKYREQQVLLDTHNCITPLTNWYDYRTNGQNPHGLWVFGDTVFVACDMTDSADAQTSTARRSYYDISYDGGVTWESNLTPVSAQGNAYPDIDPVILNGARDVALGGRQFIAGVRNGYLSPDLLLGIDNFNPVLCGGQEIFSMPTSATTIVGGFESKTTDTVYSIKFNAATTTFSGRIVLGLTADGISANTRTYSAANYNNMAATAWWDPTAGDMWVRVSTDGGTTYGAKQHAVSSTGTVNGDPVCSWLGADIIFSPTNNVEMAVSTVEQGFFISPRGTKIVYWSPVINSGNPVVIVDYHNVPSNCMLSDTNYYDSNFNSSYIQYGMTSISHPSLAYSSDGTRLFCVYTIVQRDTSSYGFYFNDVCESYSDNNGATWSTPISLTNTPQADEIYPIVARTGCTPTSIYVTWQLSACPGSTSFTNTTTPICLVYNVLKRFNPVTGIEIPIGITNISSKVPANFVLKQNYPNPFNPSTKIEFALPNAENVTLKVYNSIGQVVSTLINNARVEAGTKQVSFDASNYASGVYFYTITAGSFNQTKKMILVK